MTAPYERPLLAESCPYKELLPTPLPISRIPRAQQFTPHAPPRCAQYIIPWEYIGLIGLDVPMANFVDPEPVNRYNVAPRSKVRILHQDPDGLCWDLVRWGWEPFWAKGKRPPAINARSETAATSKFFKTIWESGRCIEPADGWYEWAEDQDDLKRKQPYYIHRRDGSEPKDGDGFVIITGDSDEGMVDIHDRRLIVLSLETAAHWLNPELSPHEAESIVTAKAEPAGAF